MPNNLQILDYYRHIKQESDEAFTDVEQEWSRNIQLYTDNYSFNDKVDWQTTVKDPIVDNLVTRFANFFSRTLISQDGKYFTAKHQVEKSIGDGAREILGGVLKDQDYPNKFNDILKYALLTAPAITKIVYEYDVDTIPTKVGGQFSFEEIRTGRTKVKWINPFNVRLDPKGDQYIRELAEIDIADFKRLGKQNNWANVDEVLRQATQSGVKDAKEGKADSPANFRPRIKLDYVYARAITSNQGEVLATNQHFIIANGEHVLLLADNIMPNGRFPYVVGFPMKVIVGRYGRGYISKLRSVLDSYLESLNLMMDQFKISTLGAYEMNMDVADSNHTATYTTFEPGKIYPKNGDGRLLQQSVSNQIDANGFLVLNNLDKIIQNRSFQNEFFQGSPTAKGRPTFGEVQTKTQESLEFFSDIANELERTVINPTLELILATELIYLDDAEKLDLTSRVDSTDAIKVLTGKTFADRMRLLREVQIETKGISAKIAKQGNFSKLIQILNVLGNFPEVVKAIPGQKLVDFIFDAIDERADILFDMEQLNTPQAEPPPQNIPPGQGAPIPTPPQGG